jgi:hypothetical protein
MSAPYACIVTRAGASCGYCNELVLAADESGHTLLWGLHFTCSPTEWWCNWYSKVFDRTIHQCPAPDAEEEIVMLSVEREMEDVR